MPHRQSRRPHPQVRSKQRLILQTLYQYRRPMNAREVAHYTGMSWVTAKKHLQALAKKKLVIAEKEGELMFYEFNYEKL